MIKENIIVGESREEIIQEQKEIHLSIRIPIEIHEKNKKIIMNFIRRECFKTNHKFKSIISILNSNEEIMKNCLFEVLKISKKYPPQKNEMKFIYGKLIEKSLIRSFDKIGFDVTDLDDSHSIGSEYKNDIKMLGVDISIKGKLNKGGNVILINKKSTSAHNINIHLLLCVINEKKLYFIPNNMVDKKKYVKEDSGCISYKSSLFTYINKFHEEYIYTFPDLSEEKMMEISLIEEDDIMTKLYNETIRV